jgi:hypothetical protein
MPRPADFRACDLVGIGSGRRQDNHILAETA